jgi:hypothetical protein
VSNPEFDEHIFNSSLIHTASGLVVISDYFPSHRTTSLVSLLNLEVSYRKVLSSFRVGSERIDAQDKSRMRILPIDFNLVSQ